MALNPDQFQDWGLPLWALYLRLPLQLVFIVWVFWTGNPASIPESDSHDRTSEQT